MLRELVAVDGIQYEQSDVGLGRQLRRCDGVVRVDVDARAGIADITYDESRISPRRLRDLIAQNGYSVAGAATPLLPMPD